MDSMNSKDLFENGNSACLHPNQAISKEHIPKLSGKQRP